MVDIAVTCGGCANGGDVDAALAAAFAQIDAFHAAMSAHLPTSDVRAISTAKAGNVVAIADVTWRVLELALRLERQTGGLFDVAIAPELVRRGLLPTFGSGSSMPPPASASAALQLEGGDRVRVLRPVWIDLGGIAKGAAVDAAIDALRRSGATAGRVHAGGDIAVFGEPQPMRVCGPEPGRHVVDAGMLEDGAIATSAWPVGAASPLVSPHGANAAWAGRAVSVVAPSCAIADALTKVVALIGSPSADVLQAHGAIAFSVDARGKIEHVA